MRIVVYAVCRRTGQISKDGTELIVLYDVKLTRSAAEASAERNPGTEVVKLSVSK